MKTFMASPATIDRKWYVVDAEGMTLGRLASEVAKVLRGKNKPIFTPHIDTGDYVIVVNAEKVKVTGKKLIFSNTSTVNGSIYTSSAISLSVIMVAGLEFTSTTSTPSSFKERHACVPA